MATNPSISQLDSGQIFKRVYDTDNDSIRVDFAGVHSSAISISATDPTPDSIITYPNSSTVKVSLTSANTGTVLPATSCVGMKSFNLYTSTLTTIVGAQVLTLQFSPSDTDDVWISTALTVTPSLTASAVVMGTMLSGVARRCRVITTAGITSGTFDLYLDMQAV